MSINFQKNNQFVKNNQLKFQHLIEVPIYYFCENFITINLYYRYDVIILKYSTKLMELTGNVPPDLLLQEMVQGEE